MASPSDPMLTTGWTNVGYTGDTEKGTGPGVTSPSTSVSLSGFLAETFSSADVTVDAFAPTTAIFYGGLVYVGTGGTTTKWVIDASTPGGVAHAYVVLLDSSGNTLAKSTDQTTLANNSGSWASSYSVVPGYYYLGVAVAWSSTPATLGGITAVGMAAGNGAALTYVAGTTLPRYVTSSGALTITSAFPSSVTLARQTTLGAPYVAMF